VIVSLAGYEAFTQTQRANSLQLSLEVVVLLYLHPCAAFCDAVTVNNYQSHFLKVRTVNTYSQARKMMALVVVRWKYICIDFTANFQNINDSQVFLGTIGHAQRVDTRPILFSHMAWV